MKEEIISSSEQPIKMEELYRKDPEQFKTSFNELYNNFADNAIAEFWNVRLNFETIISNVTPSVTPQSEAISKNFKLLFTIIASVIAGSFIRIPDLIWSNAEMYILNNLAFFVIPLLAVYYMVVNKANEKDIMIVSVIAIVGILFMNLIPWAVRSDTQRLSSLHMMFIMWAVLGAAFTGFSLTAREKQMQFIKRNGDVLMLSGIILICGMFLTALTNGLFLAIGVRLDEFVYKTIASYGIPSSFIVANYMVESSPKIINKVTPFLTKVFTPLILLLMSIFLIVLAFFGKNPFDNREELIVFNVLLAVNMAVLVFSFSGSTSKAGSFQNKVLIILSAEALIINLVALSAIVYRLFMFGVSPNRLAVLGANVLMFINLIIIAIKLLAYVRQNAKIEDVHNSMTALLPYYTIWAAIAAFSFPFIFWFK